MTEQAGFSGNAAGFLQFCDVRPPIRPGCNRRVMKFLYLLHGDSPVFLLKEPCMQHFWEELRTQRWDDHRYYHQSRINQSLHLLSAVSFLIAYVMMFTDPVKAALIGWLVAMVSRQSGHFFFEPKGYDEVNHATQEHKEAIKVGYNLRRKVILHAVWAIVPLLLWLNPTFFGLFAPYSGAEQFVRHVGELW